ncbi:MAG: hypothetical protein IJU70_09630 [Lentisphaeria bacterium]|nr:hypothetical protein [Lentisphaeria bacterium]
MKPELQQQLYEAAPLLYETASKSPAWKVELPDDLFPFLLELSQGIEKFNRRYRKRQVRVLRITIREADLQFQPLRQVPSVEQRIAAARLRIRQYRRGVLEAFLERAQAMQSTALFESRLLPDWKRVMPDERSTLRKILTYAERSAASPDDWKMLADWYRRANDRENAQRCLEATGKRKESR